MTERGRPRGPDKHRIWLRVEEAAIEALTARMRRERRRSLADTVRAIVEEALENETSSLRERAKLLG